MAQTPTQQQNMQEKAKFRLKKKKRKKHHQFVFLKGLAIGGEKSRHFQTIYDYQGHR